MASKPDGRASLRGKELSFTEANGTVAGDSFSIGDTPANANLGIPPKTVCRAKPLMQPTANALITRIRTSPINFGKRIARYPGGPAPVHGEPRHCGGAAFLA